MREVSVVPRTMNDKRRGMVGESRDLQPQLVGRVKVRDTRTLAVCVAAVTVTRRRRRVGGQEQTDRLVSLVINGTIIDKELVGS